MAAQTGSLYGLVTRGVSRSRAIDMAKSKVTSAGSAKPVIGAALPGAGVAASGICPSPASRPEVGSRPTQPAPGR